LTRVPGSWTELADVLLDGVGNAEADAAADAVNLDSSRPGDQDSVVAEARERFAAAEWAQTPFGRTVHHADLSVEEAEVFALVCAVDISTRRQRQVDQLLGEGAHGHLTLEAIGHLFGIEHLGPLAIAEDSRIRRACLVTMSAGPWASRAVQLAPSVGWALVGDESRDAGVPPAAFVVRGAPAGTDRVVVVHGDDRVRRLEAGLQRSWATGALVVPVPASNDEWEAIVREATLRGLGVVLEVDDDGLSPGSLRWITRSDHLAFIVSSKYPASLLDMEALERVEIEAAAGEISELEWTSAFPEAERSGKRFTAQQLQLLQGATRSLDGGLEEAFRRLARGPMDRLAVRVHPRFGWDDLVLPPQQTSLLHNIVERCVHREVVYTKWGMPATSKGVVAMFEGPPGTGKTMSAEIIANALGLDVYRVDLSSVVSKYIGETERNLERVFTAAEHGTMVLFFDEADSIFGKRTQVSSSHDRYANLETSYLLQRLESYDGLTILATNLPKNIDEAFRRRIHIVVNFPKPGPEERARIWTRWLSTTNAAVDDDIDVAFLAEHLELTGGNIQSAALSAAFLAAAAGSEAISMAFVVRALQREFTKAGRLLDKASLGPFASLLDEW
jgi:hypothetical protein